LKKLKKGIERGKKCTDQERVDRNQQRERKRGAGNAL